MEGLKAEADTFLPLLINRSSAPTDHRAPLPLPQPSILIFFASVETLQRPFPLILNQPPIKPAFFRGGRSCRRRFPPVVGVIFIKAPPEASISRVLSLYFYFKQFYKTDVYRPEMKVVWRVNNSLLPPAGGLHCSKSYPQCCLQWPLTAAVQRFQTDSLSMTIYFFKSSSQTFNVTLRRWEGK